MFSGEFYEISFLQNTTTSLLLLQVQGPKITNKISKILGVHTLLINTAFYKKIWSIWRFARLSLVWLFAFVLFFVFLFSSALK